MATSVCLPRPPATGARASISLPARSRRLPRPHRRPHRLGGAAVGMDALHVSSRDAEPLLRPVSAAAAATAHRRLRVRRTTPVLAAPNIANPRAFYSGAESRRGGLLTTWAVMCRCGRTRRALTSRRRAPAMARRPVRTTRWRPSSSRELISLAPHPLVAFGDKCISSSNQAFQIAQNSHLGEESNLLLLCIMDTLLSSFALSAVLN